MASLVRAEGVRRDLGGVAVLAGVDLRVESGEVVLLLGPNGAGKTTLLRVLATLARASAGRLELFGEDARTRPASVRRRIGWVGHESACYLDLTAEENLTFYAEVYGLAAGPARVAALLAWAGLEGAARRPARTYSRGMLQRLALARAVVHEPDLLLLDEPTTGLDAQAGEALVALVREQVARGAAVVMTTHDPDRMGAVATRAVTLRRGRIDG